MNRWMAASALAGAWACLWLAGCQTTSSGQSNWSLGKLFGGDGENRPSALDNRSGEEDYDVFGERNPDRLMWTDLSPSRIGTTLKTRLYGSANRQVAESSVNEGHQYYRQAIDMWERDKKGGATTRLFRKAAGSFEVASRRWPDSALEQDALFMLGESHFFADEYVLANRAYERLINQYPGTAKLDLVEARRFEIAQYWLELARQKTPLGVNLAVGDSSRPFSDLAGNARRILHRIRLDDPTGKLADDATMALGNAFLEAERFADAADAYEDLRRTYPGSQHQFHAHIFELRSRMASYRGPNYDGTDLSKAEALMKAIVRQFPNEATDQRDYLQREGAKIRNMLAERDWSLGEYYERRGENRAAQFYYEQVASNFDDTQFAGGAAERVASLTGKPPVPKQKAQWLVNLFPEKEINKPLIASGDNESFLR